MSKTWPYPVVLFVTVCLVLVCRSNGFFWPIPDAFRPYELPQKPDIRSDGSVDRPDHLPDGLAQLTPDSEESSFGTDSEQGARFQSDLPPPYVDPGDWAAQPDLSPPYVDPDDWAPQPDLSPPYVDPGDWAPQPDLSPSYVDPDDWAPPTYGDYIHEETGPDSPHVGEERADNPGDLAHGGFDVSSEWGDGSLYNPVFSEHESVDVHDHLAVDFPDQPMGNSPGQFTIDTPDQPTDYAPGDQNTDAPIHFNVDIQSQTTIYVPSQSTLVETDPPDVTVQPGVDGSDPPDVHVTDPPDVHVTDPPDADGIDHASPDGTSQPSVDVQRQSTVGVTSTDVTNKPNIDDTSKSAVEATGQASPDGTHQQNDDITDQSTEHIVDVLQVQSDKRSRITPPNGNIPSVPTEPKGNIEDVPTLRNGNTSDLPDVQPKDNTENVPVLQNRNTPDVPTQPNGNTPDLPTKPDGKTEAVPIPPNGNVSGASEQPNGNPLDTTENVNITDIPIPPTDNSSDVPTPPNVSNQDVPSQATDNMSDVPQEANSKTQDEPQRPNDKRSQIPPRPNENIQEESPRSDEDRRPNVLPRSYGRTKQTARSGVNSDDPNRQPLRHTQRDPRRHMDSDPLFFAHEQKEYRRANEATDNRQHQQRSSEPSHHGHPPLPPDWYGYPSHHPHYSQPETCTCNCNNYPHTLKEPEPSCEWVPVFKVVAESDYPVAEYYFIPYPIVEPYTSPDLAIPVPYKDFYTLTMWKYLPIHQVKLEAFAEGVRKAWFVFNGVGTDMSNWMTKERLIASNYNNIKLTSFDDFGVNGAPYGMFVIIEDDTDCASRCGYLEVVAARTTKGACTYEDIDPEPVILYSLDNDLCAEWQTAGDFGLADRLLISVKVCDTQW